MVFSVIESIVHHHWGIFKEPIQASNEWSHSINCDRFVDSKEQDPVLIAHSSNLSVPLHGTFILACLFLKGKLFSCERGRSKSHNLKINSTVKSQKWSMSISVIQQYIIYIRETFIFIHCRSIKPFQQRPCKTALYLVSLACIYKAIFFL